MKTTLNQLISRGHYFDPAWVLDLFSRYETIRDSLRAMDEALFGDIPVRPAPEPSDTTDFEGRGYITRSQLEYLRYDVDYCLSVLSNMAGVDVPSMKVTREGVFFAGQYFDALKAVTDILRDAKNALVIIDAYVDETVLDLLTNKAPHTEVQILTRNASPVLQSAASAFNRQYGKLAIRTSSSFHDRFLIIDNTEFYHFGASLKDAGNRGFMFSRIEEDKVIESLRAKFEEEWNRAVVIL